MKFLFTNTDNLYFLKDYKAVYKQAHKLEVLNSNETEYLLLKKIFSNEILTKEEISKNKKFLNKLQKQHIIAEFYEEMDTNSKIYKTYQYLKVTNKLRTKNELLKFQNKKVMIIGLGGTALEIIIQLVSIDFKNFVLVDFDSVGETNLNRQQIFKKSDLGKCKVDIVDSYIKTNVPNAHVIKYKMKITSNLDIVNILKDNNDIDMILCCADTPPIKIEQYILEPIMRNNKIAFLTSGVGIYKGSVGPLLIDYSHKKDYYDNLTKTYEMLDCTTNCSPSFGITNSLISLIMANECVNFLLGNKPLSLNKILTFYFSNYTMEIINV